jgi:hypothetical protein
MQFEDLPPEILVKILSYLPLNTLLNGLSLTSWTFYDFVHQEIEGGKLKIDLCLDQNVIQWSPEVVVSHLLSQFRPLNSLHLVHFNQPQDVLNEVRPEGIHLFLDHCDNSGLSLKGVDGLRGLHVGHEGHIPTRIYQEVASLRGGQMSSLALPTIPQPFVPLILANHGNITGTFVFAFYTRFLRN